MRLVSVLSSILALSAQSKGLAVKALRTSSASNGSSRHNFSALAATNIKRRSRIAAISRSAVIKTRGGGTSTEAGAASSSIMAVPKDIKVFYWNFPFWRAEVLRAGLFFQGIEFDNVHEKDRLDELRGQKRVPFGALPVMEVDGTILSQTQAMATYVGKLGTMYPPNDDALAQARCDEIINGCTDVTDTIAATMYGRTPAEQVEEARKKLMREEDGRLYRHLGGLDSILCLDGTNFACGGKLTVADLAVWRLVGWLAGGIIDHVPPSFVMGFPNLKKVHDAIEADSRTAAYKERFWKK